MDSAVVNATQPNSPEKVVRLAGGMRLKGRVANGTESQPLVSVITAVYNAQPYLAICLESVISQDYPNIEHIVIDAGSTDGTIDILREYDDRVALWKSEPDRGIYDAWNKALPKLIANGFVSLAQTMNFYLAQLVHT